MTRKAKTAGATFLVLAMSVAANLISAPTAQAGGYEDLQRCAQMTEQDQAEQSIALCTAAIDSGELATRNLAIAYFNRANAHRRMSAYSRAAADYSLALEIWPELDQAWNNRGGVYARLCRTEDALSDFKQAMELDPEWIRRYQRHLRNFGVDVGAIDGRYGPATENGLKRLIEAQCAEQ